jgi:hypothetical protein
MNTVSRETHYLLAGAESGKDVATESMIVTCSFDSPQEYTRIHQAISAPNHAILADETQERKEEIWNAVTSEITRYANDSTGSVSLDNETICVSGTK